jgi:hypothetical protein
MGQVGQSSFALQDQSDIGGFTGKNPKIGGTPASRFFAGKSGYFLF